jgi:hypothetical protein
MKNCQKKILGAWMSRSKKSGCQQLSCNNNFARATSALTLNALPESQDLLFREWMPLALDENEWMNLINKYFESCRETCTSTITSTNTAASRSTSTLIVPPPSLYYKCMCVLSLMNL